MSERSPVHKATVGGVTATVHHISGEESVYEVTIHCDPGPRSEFRPEELPQVAEAAEQARMFICMQEQISRMNWCPGCGG